MQDGSWTIDGCDYAEVKALADALELGEITASILVRRGHTDVEAARAFVIGEIEPHDPFRLGDMAVAVDRIRTAIDRSWEAAADQSRTDERRKGL